MAIMTLHMYELQSNFLSDVHIEMQSLFSHLETLDIEKVKQKQYPGLNYIAKDIGYCVWPEYIKQFNNYKINQLFTELQYLRPIIRFNNYPNLPGKRDGISIHIDKASQNDPCAGIQSAALMFGIEGCDSNTVNRWYRVIDAKWPDDFVYDEQISYLAVGIKNLQGVEIIEEGYIETNKQYLFRTNIYHDARAKEHTGVRRILGCIHFTNACNWDDYVEQFKRKGWI